MFSRYQIKIKLKQITNKQAHKQGFNFRSLSLLHVISYPRLISQLKERIFLHEEKERWERRREEENLRRGEIVRVDCNFERFRRLRAVRAMLLIMVKSPLKFLFLEV